MDAQTTRSHRRLVRSVRVSARLGLVGGGEALFLSHYSPGHCSPSLRARSHQLIGIFLTTSETLVETPRVCN